MNETTMAAFVDKAVGDVGALLVVISDKLGRYRALAGAGPLTRPSWPRGPARPTAMRATGTGPTHEIRADH
jgi:hypothetical protein